MPNPKIKLYRLPRNYSQSTDKDIQNATNDQLLPVSLKKVMPNQAYTLVGVDNKKSSVLIPTIHVDKDIVYSVQQQNNFIKINENSYIPSSVTINSITYYINRNLACTKPNMCPVFFYLNVSTTSTKFVYLTYGKQYIYVSDINNYVFDSQSTLWLVFGYDESTSQQSPKWKIKINNSDNTPAPESLGTSDLPLYVKNLFLYEIQQCVCHFNVVDKNTKYFLTKSDSCQSDFIQSSSSSSCSSFFSYSCPNQFVPLLEQGQPDFLKPIIYYDSDFLDSSTSSSSESSFSGKQRVFLTQQNNNFNISKDYVLSKITSSSPTSERPYNDVFGKTVTLIYYTIKRNIVVENEISSSSSSISSFQSMFISGYYNESDRSFYRQYNDGVFSNKIDGKIGYIYHDKFNFYQYNTQTKVFYRTTLTTATDPIICYFNPNDNNCYMDSKYLYKIDGQEGKIYLVKNNNYKWNFYNYFYRTHQSNNVGNYQQHFNPQLYYSAYNQSLYNGTVNSIKPNTMFLQYLKLSNFRNFNFSLSDSSERTVTIKNYQKNLYDEISKIPQSERTEKQTQIFNYLTNNIDTNTYIDFSRGIVISQKDTSDSAFQRRKFKNQNQPGEYFVDVKKGMFKLLSEHCIKDYFYCDYYYQISPAKLFVSDYQCWVSQHLRNNPDIFYGKKNYPGDDYIDSNDVSISTGAIPCFVQDGYTIQYRNGSVSFGAPHQDLSLTGETEVEEEGTQTDENGVVIGGVARANFAYYTKIQSVSQQKLDYDPTYHGGGYKYRAINDKQYPDSINKRWVSRNEPNQFLVTSFTTKAYNQQGQLVDYNLPDLQTSQLQSLNKIGFQIGQDISSSSSDSSSTYTKIERKYDLYSNQFSNPHFYKINNLNSNKQKPYVTSLTKEQVRQINPSETFDLNKFVFQRSDLFQSNYIYFKTLQEDLIDQIKVDYCQISILPAIKITMPVFVKEIKTNNLCRFKIQKNQDCQYSNFQLYTLNGNQRVKLNFDFTITQTEQYIITSDLSGLKHICENAYLKFHKTIHLFRSYMDFQETITNDKDIIETEINYNENSSGSSSSDSSISSLVQYVIPKSYKNVRIEGTNGIIFSISDLLQTVYFNIKVLDIFNMENQYNKTVVYFIKKNENI